MARFSVWNGVSINPAYRDLKDVRDAVAVRLYNHMAIG